jgi:hypothetical protein
MNSPRQDSKRLLALPNGWRMIGLPFKVYFVFFGQSLSLLSAKLSVHLLRS